uniref:Uncharacterized protein n=1 Tax=Globodera rostochiensis TaxID=31243 RepID=A0A914GU17_GLORO
MSRQRPPPIRRIVSRCSLTSPIARRRYLPWPVPTAIPRALFLFLPLLFISSSVSAQSYESAELRILEEKGGKRMFYQPWSYMKRTPSTEPIIRFEKRSGDDQFMEGFKPLSSADPFRFFKRSIVVPLMRFGRRPAERAAPLIRFGKRAQIRTANAVPLIRFGRSSEEERQ